MALKRAVYAPTALMEVHTANDSLRMKFTKTIFIAASLLAVNIMQAQGVMPLSVKDISPSYGIAPRYIENPTSFCQYLDSLPQDNKALTDSCIALNTKVRNLLNTLRHDYHIQHDTIWIDANNAIVDFATYQTKLELLSEYAHERSHTYIERENNRINTIEQAELKLRKDTINSRHRTIVNACDAFGVTDKNRIKELKDLYYAYLSVYNRYDLSMKRSDSTYRNELRKFSDFQKELIENMVDPNNNYTTRINSFANTLKLRTAHNHVDVYRSYQRVFKLESNPVNFSSINEYHDYADRQEEILELQQSYIKVVEMREQMADNSRKIISLYSPKYSSAAKTYKEIADVIETIPSFTTLVSAHDFCTRLQEFIDVQKCYLSDYSRLLSITTKGDSIRYACTSKTHDVAKAYKALYDGFVLTPTYRTLDDAVFYAKTLDNFEALQSQYDSILALRNEIEQCRNAITTGWMKHLKVYNGYMAISKQYVLTPSFITIEDGNRFISHLREFLDMEHLCINAIETYQKSEALADTINILSTNYKNIHKASQRLENDYLSTKTISSIESLSNFAEEYKRNIRAQEVILKLLRGRDAHATDNRLKDVKSPSQIEIILGL